MQLASLVAASQIVVALLICSGTNSIYISSRPFKEEDDDDLAIATQGSLYFTLLAALLKRVQVDETDGYNQTLFGAVLIAVNCLGIGLVFFGFLTKPLYFVMNALFGKKNIYNGALRCMDPETTRDRSGFVQHFVRVAMSTQEEGGWEVYVKQSGKWMTFLDYSGAIVERRCSEGRGIIDETRCIFVVSWRVDRVRKWLVNENRDLRQGEVASHEIRGQRSESGRKVLYYVRKMKEGFSRRDYLVESFHGSLEDGGGYVVCRR